MKSSPGGSQRAKASVPSALCRMDLLLLRDAGFPGLGYSAWRKCWGSQAGIELCPWAQGWAHRGGSSQEGAGAGDRESEDKELHPGDGQGSQGRAGSCSCTEWAAWVGAPPQTVNSSKANKRNTSFEGQKEFMASGQTQQIFLARRGRVLNHHFLN